MSKWKLWGAKQEEKVAQVEATPPGTLFYLFSTKWTNPTNGRKRPYDKFVKIWWGPKNNGYTYDLNEAGLYTREVILDSPGYYCSEDVYALPQAAVEAGQFGRVMRSVYN